MMKMRWMNEMIAGPVPCASQPLLRYLCWVLALDKYRGLIKNEYMECRRIKIDWNFINNDIMGIIENAKIKNS